MCTEQLQAYIGLGTNLGDRVQNIIDARTYLSQLKGVTSNRCSSLYVSSPVGYLEQPDFVNCVLELTLSQTAEQLFEAMCFIETKLGRVRHASNQNAARVIDCDLLLFGKQSINTEHLTVPHPRMTERLFVLKPLVELDPSIVIGGLGQARELLLGNNFADQHLYKIA